MIESPVAKGRELNIAVVGAGPVGAPRHHVQRASHLMRSRAIIVHS
jgi:hypothetical protein